MTITKHQFYSTFLLIALAFYMGFIRFFASLLSGDDQRSAFESGVSGNIINQIVGLGLLAVSLFFLIQQHKTKLRQLWLFGWPLLLLCGLFILSISWSDVSSVSLRRCVAFVTLVLVCYTIAQVFTPISLLNLLANLVCATVVIGFAYTFISGSELSLGLSDREAGFRGMFDNKNGAARVYAYGLLLFIALKRYRSFVDKILLSMLILAVLLSQSASAVMMCIIGGSIILALNLLRGRNKIHTLQRLFVLSFVSALFGFIAYYSYDFILSLLGRDSNLTNRAIIWELLTPYAQDKWLLGYGFGAFWASSTVADFIQRWDFIGNAHSGYFEVVLHSGVIGFVLLCLMIFVAVQRGFAVYIRTSPQRKYETVFCSALFLVQAITNYIAYIILNHNSFDMFLFTLSFFIIARLYFLGKTNA
ncbi:O-antigen ligase family protein [Glaciecola sp. MH2013]|uniref:O-antigen ligase family protein n=1 Tax=Glaciecola sp. MH2013 TaxID=2785524 RepID=UPI00189FC1F3|nr:O-antigen ligase family protein [Glaciecola sp. MH2013]MBF7074874.1 O-antigen ligase family protein [Glaciecola sp. MH2013]